MKVLFVCTGNTCRSPMAEAIYNYLTDKYSLDGQARSAGIFALDGGKISENSKEAMAELGIDISNYKSKLISKEDLDRADLILTMSAGHKMSIINMYPDVEDKVFLLNEYALNKDKDIEDPYGQDLSAYKSARDEIYRAVEKIIETRR